MDPVKGSSLNWTEPVDFLTPEQANAWEWHMNEHAVLAHRMRTGDGRAYTISDFDTRTRFHRRGLYNEFYRRISVEDVLGMFPHARPPVEIGIALHRDRANFSGRERLLMNLLRPHLAQAWRNAQAVTRVRRDLSTLRQTLDSLDYGVICLNREGRVELMTPRARQSLAAFFESTRQRGDLLPETLERWVRWQEELLEGSGVPPPRVPLVVEWEGKRLVVRLLSAPGRSLLLLEEQQLLLAPRSLLSLGLTWREAEVLSWVAQGKTNVEIAAILSISPRTVQKHLERIFVKLGVENRTAAAALALQVSGLAPGTPGQTAA